MTKFLLSLSLMALMILVFYWLINLFVPQFGYRIIPLSIILGAVVGYYIYTIIDNNLLD